MLERYLDHLGVPAGEDPARLWLALLVEDSST